MEKLCKVITWVCIVFLGAVLACFGYNWHKSKQENEDV